VVELLCPDIAERSVFLCGPDGFVKAFATAARSLGVPRSSISHGSVRVLGEPRDQSPDRHTFHAGRPAGRARRAAHCRRPAGGGDRSLCRHNRRRLHQGGGHGRQQGLAADRGGRSHRRRTAT
jgi:hypothetical protein